MRRTFQSLCLQATLWKNKDLLKFPRTKKKVLVIRHLKITLLTLEKLLKLRERWLYCTYPAKAAHFRFLYWSPQSNFRFCINLKFKITYNIFLPSDNWKHFGIFEPVLMVNSCNCKLQFSHLLALNCLHLQNFKFQPQFYKLHAGTSESMRTSSNLFN